MKTYGQIAYEAYIVAVGGKSITGADLPAWDDQESTKIGNAWEAAGEAAAQAALQTPPFQL